MGASAEAALRHSLANFTDMKKKKIWITWEKHRRTRELSQALGDVKLYEIVMRGPRIPRLLKLLRHTGKILRKENPDIVLVQAPSNILALFIVIMAKWRKFRVCIDAHNGGVRQYRAGLRWVGPVYRFIHQMSHLVIVTNKSLAREVEKNGGAPFILPDPIPKWRRYSYRRLQGEYNFVYICTYAMDEPYTEVIEAAKMMGENIYIYITGDYRKVSSSLRKSASSNIVFTGYLPDQDYINLLYSAHAVIDLTLIDDCLVCGAYESIALNKPAILSDTPVVRDLFPKGIAYTRNTAAHIRAAVYQVIKNYDNYRRDIGLLKRDYNQYWDKRFQALSNHIHSL
jgi:glycosyltransferase involved in cell wall biosynthesis